MVCEGDIKKHDRENRRIGNKVQEEGSYLGDIFKKSIGPAKNGNQINGQTTPVRNTRKTQG